MTEASEEKSTSRGHRHLSPAEVQAIADARAHGAKVTELSHQYGVSRQSIYCTVAAAKEMQAEPSQGGGALPKKRHRAKRITPEVEKGVADMKRKYPTWGVDYIREQWAKSGHPRVSRASIYRILREAGLQARQPADNEAYQPSSFVLKGAILDHLGRLDEVAIFIEEMLAFNPKLLKVIGPTFFPHFSKTSGFFKYKTGDLMNPPKS